MPTMKSLHPSLECIDSCNTEPWFISSNSTIKKRIRQPPKTRKVCRHTSLEAMVGMGLSVSCHSSISSSTASTTSTTSCDSSVRDVFAKESNHASHHRGGRPDYHRSQNEIMYRPRKTVTFACDANGRVTRHEKQMSSRLGKDLWWNQEEMQKIRSDCIHTVASVRTTGGLNGETDVRGLERYIHDDYDDDSINEYRQSILANQEFSGFDKSVSKEAAKFSRAAQKQAQRLAKLDTREALKSALTKWDSDETSCHADEAALIVD